MNKKISALVTSIAMLASSAAFVPTVSAQAESPRSADLSTSLFPRNNQSGRSRLMRGLHNSILSVHL